MAIGNTALKTAGTTAAFWDNARYKFKARLGLVSPPILMPYGSYAANGRLHDKGRVIEDEGIVDAPISRSRWANLKRSVRCYETNEVRVALVK